MIIAPFPFDSLPKLTRDDVSDQARLRALSAKLAPDLERALSETVGAPVRLRWERGSSVNGVTVAIRAGEHTIVVDAETALARELVARALKHGAGIDDAKTPSAAVYGAFAAVLVHALRKANVGPVKASRSNAETRGTAARLAVEIAGASFEASVTIPARVLAPPAPPASLDFPVSLPLAASCLASRADVEALAPGDVFVPPGLLAGPFGLVAPPSERGLAVELSGEDDQRPRVVLRKGPFAPFSWEPPMSADANTTHATLEVALDASVVVRVELGAVEMKAREWAALAEGDVIRLGRKLGEPAILRIAGSEVARGELVQVDGEYGIRITSTPPKSP